MVDSEDKSQLSPYTLNQMSNPKKSDYNDDLVSDEKSNSPIDVEIENDEITLVDQSVKINANTDEKSEKDSNTINENAKQLKENINEEEKNETEEPNKIENVSEKDEEDENDDIEPELVNITRYSDPNPLVTRIQMGEECSGVLGDLQQRTCANPNMLLEEIEFKKKRGPETGILRIRPRTPIGPTPRRNRKGKRKNVRNNDPKLAAQIKKITSILSPVCGDDSLATFLVKGYSYRSPMARNLQIPIYDSDDEISDNDLESNVCNECIFCTREGIRHHKNKPNEISLIRRVRSPCRCFHECVTEENEQNGKNFIMERFLRQKLDDFSPDLKYTEELKAGARSPIAEGEAEEQDEEPPAKLPRIISNEEITKTREKLTVNSPVAVQKTIKLEERILEKEAVNEKPAESMKSIFVEKPVIQNQIKPKEEQIEIVEISADQSVSIPKPILVEQIKRHSCHPTGFRPGELAKAPLRVSVIQPTKASITSSSPPLDGAGSPRVGGGARAQSLLDMYPIRHLTSRSSSHHHHQHMASNSQMIHHQTGFQAVQSGSSQIRPTVSLSSQPMSAFGITAADQTVIKVENPNQLEAYGIRPTNHPYVQNAFGPGASPGSGRSSGLGSNSVSASSISQFSGHDGRSFYIKQPYTQPTCHGAPVGRSVPVNRLQGNSTPFSQLSGSSFSGHYPIQPHEQNGSSRSLYSQDDLNRRIMQPGHPPRIRACIERLATRLTVSRHIKEQNEKQVSELLQLACEVKREEECETFYCTWRDCIKHFNRRDSLVRHLRVHVDVRPFKCERCSMHFLRSDHLRVHMLRHTGEQPFACIICGETFSRRDMRNRHMKTIHYRDTLPPQNVLDLLEGESWDAIEIDPDLIRNQNRT